MVVATRSRSNQNKKGMFARHAQVLVYIPNLIGYARVALTIVALAVAHSTPNVTLALYLCSFVLDELDGRAARAFNQSSTFGAVLDMVTDRLSTAGLLFVVGTVVAQTGGAWHRRSLPLALLWLDLASHWYHCQASAMAGSHHKVRFAQARGLLAFYYNKRIFMGALCIGAEVAVVAWYAALWKADTCWLAQPAPHALTNAVPAALLEVIARLFVADDARGAAAEAQNASTALVLLAVAVPISAVKQYVNVLQLSRAVSDLIEIDRSHEK